MYAAVEIFRVATQSPIVLFQMYQLLRVSNNYFH